jgi:P4 family phage/plasmid primase-like protien
MARQQLVGGSNKGTMAPLTKLEKFLNGDPNSPSESGKKGRVVAEAGRPFTHTTMAEPRIKWNIASDDLPEFYKLYAAEIRQCTVQYMTEKGSPIGSMRVDLDFKYSGEVSEHKHTQSQVVEFTKAYMSEIKKFLAVPESVEIFILEKSQPVFDKVHKTSKSGVHIQVPSLKTNAGVEQTVRRNLLGRMEEFFPGLDLLGDWKACYDPQPLTHTNNWMILGSKKQDGFPYEIVYILDWDAESGDISVDDDVPHFSAELVQKLSVRAPTSEETEMTEYGKDNVRVHVQQETATGPGQAPTRGRTTERGEPGSRGSSPGRYYLEPLSPQMRKYYEDHVMNLSSERYTDYKNWIDVGNCLKNIHPDLQDIWFDFGAQWEKFNQREAIAKWNSFGGRADGEKLGVGSLRKWSREDNLDGFKKIEDNNIDRLIMESLSGTEHDVAMVVHATYKDEFKCSKFGISEWFRFNGNTWTDTDQGVALRCRLSKDIADLYLRKEMAFSHELSESGGCACKTFTPTCSPCVLEKKKKNCNEVRLKLKRTGFKKSVMDEGKELFLDEEFGRKLNENKTLTAFNNGVFDTNALVFRQGHPEDYISITTELDYDSSPYDTHKCWTELSRFLADILPFPDVREYFMCHLSTCLVGGNNQQKFHILTGSGSNGKSMLMNLVSKCFGKYTCKVPIALLTQKRGKSGAAAPEIVKMKGARIVMMQEPDEGEPLSSGVMKEMVSSETMVARDLYAGTKAMVEFEPPKMHLTCNEKPKISTMDGGTWRRVVVIDFPSKFVVSPVAPNEKPMDDTIVQKTQSEEWAVTFMSFLVQTFIRGSGWRKLVPPPRAMEHTNEYKEENDVIARFLREWVHPHTDGEDVESVTQTAIRVAFSQWKRENEVMNSATPEQLLKRIVGMYGKFTRGGWTSFRLGTS